MAEKPLSAFPEPAATREESSVRLWPGAVSMALQTNKNDNRRAVCIYSALLAIKCPARAR